MQLLLMNQYFVILCGKVPEVGAPPGAAIQGKGRAGAYARGRGSGEGGGEAGAGLRAVRPGAWGCVRWGGECEGFRRELRFPLKLTIDSFLTCRKVNFLIE